MSDAVRALRLLGGWLGGGCMTCSDAVMVCLSVCLQCSQIVG